jgi:hypothetical protein
VWTILTNTGRTLSVQSLSGAKRVCQLWEDIYGLADMCLLDGDLETAERLRTEPDKYD